MAQDSSHAVKNDIDLDDIEVEILVIAKQPKSLAQTAAFLSRRGWPTTVLNDFSKALEFAAEKKPDIVVISLNHGNPALSKFAELMSSTFKATCVAFIETMDTASNAKLNRANFKHKVIGRASGPTFQRAIRKVLAEKFNIVEEKTSEAPAKKDAGPVTIRGEKGHAASGPSSVTQKGEPGATTKKGPTFIKGESVTEGSGKETGRSSVNYTGESGGTGSGSEYNAVGGDGVNGSTTTSEDGLESQEVVKTGKYTMTTKNRRSLKEMAAAGLTHEASGPETGGAEDPEALAAKLKQSLFGGNAGEEYLAAKARAKDTATAGAAEAQTESSNEAGRKNAKVDGPAGSTGGNLATTPPRGSAAAIDKDKLTAEQIADSLSARPGQLTAENMGAPRAETLESEIDLFAGNEELKLQSLIEKAVNSALSRICKSGSGQPDDLQIVDQVSVFPVDSDQLPGYLVIAWPVDSISAREAFFKLAQDTLQTVFQEMGVKAKLEPGFFVQLPKVEFLNWTSEQANFCFSMPHEEQELGVAFFSTKEPLPKARQLEDKPMYAIGLDHISTEQPVNFKAYLHLKKNRKYYLYLRNGRMLAPEQKARLKQRHVKDLNVKSVDIENLRMFIAACFLRDKIKGSSEAA